MINIDDLKKISPTNLDNPFEKVPFDDFFSCAKSILPNFPKDVLDQWVYENFSQFADEIENGAKYAQLKFSLEEVDLTEILTIKDPSQFYECGVGRHIIDGTLDTPLIRYMRTHPTWPRAIIIKKEVDNDTQIAEYVLLEGHLRLVYLHRLFDEKLPLKQKHMVWIATEE